MLPIGGHDTRDPRGTFPLLAGTPAQLRTELAARGINDVRVHDCQPGETIE